MGYPPAEGAVGTLAEVQALVAWLSPYGLAAVLGGVAAWFARSYFFSYVGKRGENRAQLEDIAAITRLAKKAENLATKEDIAAITHEVEGVKVQYTQLVEEGKARHQMRMAVIDKRLAAHQTAFSLWRQLQRYVHGDQAEMLRVVMRCQEWWEENCLYLEPSVRQQFVASYMAAHQHGGLLAGNASADELKANFGVIQRFGNVVMKAVELPGLSDAEAELLANADRSAIVSMYYTTPKTGP